MRINKIFRECIIAILIVSAITVTCMPVHAACNAANGQIHNLAVNGPAYVGVGTTNTYTLTIINTVNNQGVSVSASDVSWELPDGFTVVGGVTEGVASIELIAPDTASGTEGDKKIICNYNKTGWKSEDDSGDYTVSGCGKDRDITVVEVAMSSVSSADYIDDDATGRKVYATANHATVDAEITLSCTPSVTLPSGLVTWTGGTAGVTQLKRVVSRAELMQSGLDVTATLQGTKVFKGKVYVFAGAPTAAPVVIDVTPIEDNSVVPANVFGATDRSKMWLPSASILVYYENNKWKFVFDSISWEAKWGLNYSKCSNVWLGIQTVTPGTGMDIMTPTAVCRAVAKKDLTPDTNGVPPRDHYWAAAITEKHEKFHIDDFVDNYYTAKMGEAEATIEAASQYVTVSLSNLNPSAVVQSKATTFATEIINKTNAAYTLFEPQCEPRAYADGHGDYVTLSNSL